MADHPTFLLAVHRINPEADQIGDQRVEPKTMAVLLALVEAAPKPVTPQELLEKVWSNRVVVDNVVHKTIGRLRQALNDDARQPTYIETVPRRGYRLIANVEPVQDERAEVGVEVQVEKQPLSDVPPPAQQANWSSSLTKVIGAFRSKTSIVAVCAALLLSSLYFLSTGETERTAAKLPVIAVAPLRDLSVEKDLDWLTEGLAEAIRRQIASWQRYEVLHRSRSAIGTKALSDLPADLLLDGYLQTVEEDIVLVLSIVELPSGKTLWQDEFKGNPTDPLAMQARIAANVARHFNESTPASPALKNPAAYQAYLKSLHFEYMHDPRKEIYWIEKALALEPEWTQGWQRLLIAYSIIFHTQYDPEAARQSTAAFAKLDDSLGNIFFKIYHTAYIEDDFFAAEALIAQWLDMEYNGKQGPGPFAPYAVYSYARLMQETGLHRSAAIAYEHVTDEVPHDVSGWQGLALNLIKLRDFSRAKAAAKKYAELVPTLAGAGADDYLLHIAALEGDTVGVAAMLEKAEAARGHRLPIVRFNLAMAQNDLTTARDELQRLTAIGWYRAAAYGYLRTGDEQAAAMQFENAKQHDPTGVFIHASNTLTMDPEDSQHPLVLDYEAHIGIPVSWRVELCAKAAAMPKASRIRCDPAVLDNS